MKPDHSVGKKMEGRSAPRAQADRAVECLEALAPGRRLCTKDGTPFIRTNRTCICFCNLLTGVLCSAKDICYRYGGIDEQVLVPLGQERDHEQAT